MYCGKCGKKLTDNAVFCSYCGYKVNGSGNEKRNSNGNIIFLILIILVTVMEALGFLIPVLSFSVFGYSKSFSIINIWELRAYFADMTEELDAAELFFICATICSIICLISAVAFLVRLAQGKRGYSLTVFSDICSWSYMIEVIFMVSLKCYIDKMSKVDWTTESLSVCSVSAFVWVLCLISIINEFGITRGYLDSYSDD